MELNRSFFTDLCLMQASEEFFSDVDSLKSMIEEVLVENERLKSRYDYPEFKLHLESHLKKDNLKNATNSLGCGCSLCQARFSYVSAKRSLDWFRNCYLSDFNHYLFEEMFIREADSYGPISLSKQDYYDVKKDEFIKYMNSFKSRYEDIKFRYIDLNLIDSKARPIYEIT